MDGGAWRATVHGVAKSRTQLSDFIFTFMCSLQLTSKMAHFPSLFHHADRTTIKNCISFISCVLSMCIYISMYTSIWASLVAQLVKNLPAMQETLV